MNSDTKNSKNDKLILLEYIKKQEDLNDNEKDLKEKLLEIENKLKSVEKSVLSITKNDPSSIYNIDNFNVLICSIAIAAAIETIAKHFNIDPKLLDI